MVEAKILPNLITLNIVINFHCHIGRMEFTFKVFEGMEVHGNILDVITFNTLIKGILALKLFNQMVSKQYATISVVKPRA
jgi:pentatricopeptide repeat protein